MDRCANPLKQTGEKAHVGKALRLISKKILAQFPHLPKNCKICAACDKNIHLRDVHHHDDDMEIDEAISEMDVDDPKSEDRVDQTKSPRELELEEMLEGLKNKFCSLENTDPLRVQILTIAPSSWSSRKIAKEFGTSRYLAKKSKELKARNGVLPETTAKCGNVLPQATIDAVVEFYNDDENSRLMPGMKDTISVVVDGNRSLEQKRLLLLSLRELHVSLKELDKEKKFPISYTAFAKLRPRHCILPGASGTHSVCVCTIHENVKMMLDALNIEALTNNSDMPLGNYTDCLNEMICKNSGANCYLDRCLKCPGTTKLSEHLSQLLENSCISHVEFCTWTGTDRSTLINRKMDVDEFIDELCSKLEILKPHSFIAKQQAEFIREKKKNLKEGEVIVMFDFSENYAYVCQDASQAFYFNNDQCTVIPVIYYYKNNDELVHKSNVFLTESSKHDTAAVYAVQTLLIPEIRKQVKNLVKIIYMTDGAKQHFKNKYQIANLIEHKKDFGVVAEWHYSATAHGKSAYDGIGATFKREAYRKSLTVKPKDALLTPLTLFKWAETHFKNIRIWYFTKVYHDNMRRKLNKRFGNAEPVPQIMKNHAFIVETDDRVVIGRYSGDTNKVFWSPN